MELIARIREKRRIATLTKADKFTPCGMNIYHYFGSRSKRFPNVYYSFLFKIVSDAFLNANNSNAYYFIFISATLCAVIYLLITCLTSVRDESYLLSSLFSLSFSSSTSSCSMAGIVTSNANLSCALVVEITD